jgi:hypothetical protein
MRNVIFNGPECDVEAVCYNLDTEEVILEVDYRYADGCAVVEFDTIDDMIQFATDVKLWAMQLKASQQPKQCPCPSHHPSCDCDGMGGDR